MFLCCDEPVCSDDCGRVSAFERRPINGSTLRSLFGRWIGPEFEIEGGYQQCESLRHPQSELALSQ
jgi:hypothetical protein